VGQAARDVTPDDITICVCTWGDPAWVKKAAAVALPSAFGQGTPVMAVHGADMVQARTNAAQCAGTDWLVYLDADDQLAPDYAQAIADGTGDLRAPTLIEHWPDGTTRTPDLTTRDIQDWNPCCIGTGIRRDLVLDIGWSDWPAYEDWALFLAAARRGATIEHLPAARYHAQVRPGSRNRSIPDPQALCDQIKAQAW
jgi:hypothetical protein